MKEFVFIKQDGRLRLTGRAKQEYPAWVEALGEGEHFRAKFTSLSASKSQEQLGYYYAVVIPDVIAGMKELGCEEVGYTVIAGTRVPLATNTDNVDRYLKTLYATANGIEDMVSKARMSKAEMSRFLEFVLGWAHQNAIAVRPAENGAAC